jgi:hypothetical protein
MRYGEERFAITSPKADHPPKIVGSALSVIAPSPRRSRHPTRRIVGSVRHFSASVICQQALCLHKTLVSVDTGRRRAKITLTKFCSF